MESKFKIGDEVCLKSHVEDGIFEACIIKDFQKEEGGNEWFPNGNFPKGTIITDTGVIVPENACSPDYSTENYRLKNTECLSIKDVIKVLGSTKHTKKLLKLVKNKIDII